MRPILFHLGNLAVPSFWVMAFLGFFAAFVVIRSDLMRRGLAAHLAYDITLYAYVGGWVGARLFLIPSAWDMFTQDPFGFLVMSSGWVWYGGVIGGALAVALLARQRKIPFLVVADVATPALAIGLGIGRIGCQLAGDGDYGIPTTLPWGMSYPEGVVPTNERVHPAPIYEAIACFLIFAYVWRQRLQNLHPGDLTGRYFIMAAVVRFLVEFVRRNPAWLAGLTTAQWMSVGLALAGAVLVRYRSAADVTAAPVR